jgi:SAM-dependent methyltransferase
LKPTGGWVTVQTMFDELADVYEAMIDWPKRLAHEGPFYRRLFDRLGAGSGCEKMGTGSVLPRENVAGEACRTVPVPISSGSVVDVACGTGHHAAMFHGWGLRVDGADLSPAMIDRARSKFGQPDGLRWVVRAFDEPIAPAEPFDAAVCVGNSLALAPDTATVQRAIRQMLSAVRGGGAIVIQVLNLWRLPDGPCVWQKCQRAVLPGAGKGDRHHLPERPFGCFAQMVPVPFSGPFSGPGENQVLILKGVHRCGTGGYVELIVADPAASAIVRSESTAFLGLDASELERMARDAGAKRIAFLGGYGDQPYDRQESVDLMMVAEK